MANATDRARLLGALQREIRETGGIAPFNFLPTMVVHDACEVFAVDFVKTAKGAPVRPGLRVSAEVVLSQPVPHLKSGQSLHLCPLWLTLDGDIKFFVPWGVSGIYLKCGGGQRRRLLVPAGLRENWCVDATHVLSVATDGSVLRLQGVDERVAERDRRLSEVRRADAVALIVAGSSPVPVPQAVSALESRLKRAHFQDRPSEGTEMQIELRLKDPVVLLRIQQPVRGRYCEHAQAFDLTAFIRMVSEQRQGNDDLGFKCSVCGRSINIRDMVIDLTFAELLRSHRDGSGLVSQHHESLRMFSGEYSRVYGSGAADPDAVKRVLEHQREPQATGSKVSPQGSVVLLRRGGVARVDAPGPQGQVTTLVPHPYFPGGEAWVLEYARPAGRPEAAEPVRGKWVSKLRGFYAVYVPDGAAAQQQLLAGMKRRRLRPSPVPSEDATHDII
eukprot:TRINITY_DN25920_c0_g1_i1.p1 TRINITY_DN25920_c0_g1~~TRINITY_DN25920_c0_g1_i1.p1  ORF type:complete len:463 (+),score=106.41 TRINITY_DN25920_c0_g1_i1:57-1391(+)